MFIFDPFKGFQGLRQGCPLLMEDKDFSSQANGYPQFKKGMS
jgi:hypothetical protein